MEEYKKLGLEFVAKFETKLKIGGEKKKLKKKDI